MLPTTPTVGDDDMGPIPDQADQPATLEGPMDPETFAGLVAATALEKKAQDVAILDLRGHIDYADIFVLCTANNPRQVVAIASEVRRFAKQEHSQHPVSVEGMKAAHWVLVDYGDVVLHVFDPSSRGFYDLDGLWSDAPRLAVPQVEGTEEALFPLA
jgi:ribosome-associated protein